MSIKKQLKEDTWNIINKEKIEGIDFKFLVFQLLLEREGFNVKDVLDYSKKLEDKYKGILDKVEECIIKGNGEVFKVLEEVCTYYDREIDPLIKSLREKKWK